MDGDGPLPIELSALSVIDRFGTEAVYGRLLYTHEIKGFIAAEIIKDAYNERKRSGDYAKWSRKYPNKAKALSEAMKNG